MCAYYMTTGEYQTVSWVIILPFQSEAPDTITGGIRRKKEKMENTGECQRPGFRATRNGEQSWLSDMNWISGEQNMSPLLSQDGASPRYGKGMLRFVKNLLIRNIYMKRLETGTDAVSSAQDSFDLYGVNSWVTKTPDSFLTELNLLLNLISSVVRDVWSTSMRHTQLLSHFLLDLQV